MTAADAVPVLSVLSVLAALAVAAAVLLLPGRRSRAGRLVAGPPGGRSASELPPARRRLPVTTLVQLVAAALETGLPGPAAVEAAAGAAGHGPDLQLAPAAWRLGRPAAAAWGDAPPAYATLARGLLLAEVTGAPAAALLRRAADDARHRRQSAARQRAARLGVRLVVPLGLTTLPAFVLLGVAPVLLGVALPVLRGS